MVFKKRFKILAFVLIVVMLLSACQDPRVKKENEHNEKLAKEYLEKRYGDQEEFEYLGSRYTGSPYRNTFKFRGLKEGIYFEVTVIGDKDIHNRYLSSLWDKQFIQQYVPTIQEFFKEKTMVDRAYISPKTGFEEKVIDDNGYVDLSKYDLKNMNHEIMGEYILSFEVRFYIFMDVQDDNLDPLFEEMMTYVDYLKEIGVPNTMLDFYVFKKEALEDEELKEYFTSNYMSDEFSRLLYDTEYGMYQVSSPSGFYVEEVNNIDELKAFYKVYNNKKERLQ